MEFCVSNPEKMICDVVVQKSRFAVFSSTALRFPNSVLEEHFNICFAFDPSNHVFILSFDGVLDLLNCLGKTILLPFIKCVQCMEQCFTVNMKNVLN